MLRSAEKSRSTTFLSDPTFSTRIGNLTPAVFFNALRIRV